MAEAARLRRQRQRWQRRPGTKAIEGEAAAAVDGAGSAARVTIYLATDSLNVVREAVKYAAEFDFVALKEAEVMRHDFK